MARYAANLLLEYQVLEKPFVRPLCERRIVVFDAATPRAAIAHAKRLGKAAQYRYRNADGHTVRVSFVGLIDVLDIGVLDTGEVYYSMSRMAEPRRHVKADAKLAVNAGRRKTIGAAWWAVPEERAKRRPTPARQARHVGARPDLTSREPFCSVSIDRPLPRSPARPRGCDTKTRPGA